MVRALNTHTMTYVGRIVDDTIATLRGTKREVTLQGFKIITADKCESLDICVCIVCGWRI